MTAAHEPRRAPDAHLSAEELSVAAEGRQDGAAGGMDRIQDVAEHLRDCQDCRAEADAMAGLLAALADLDEPPLPPEVALRIDAALAQAALDDASLGETALDSALTGARSADAAPDDSATPHDVVTVSLSSPGGVAPSLSRRRPPSPLPRTRRPASRRSPSRRPLRNGAGWVLASLMLLGGVIGLAAIVSSPGQSSSSATSASSGGGAAENPRGMVQNGIASGGAPAPLTLANWTKTALSAASSASAPGDSSSGTRANALTAGPSSSIGAASISQCLANPAFNGRQVLATAYGTFDATPAVLVVYANGDGSPSVYAVAYKAPCASSAYDVLAEGTVPK